MLLSFERTIVDKFCPNELNIVTEILLKSIHFKCNWSLAGFGYSKISFSKIGSLIPKGFDTPLLQNGYWQFGFYILSFVTLLLKYLLNSLTEIREGVI